MGACCTCQRGQRFDGFIVEDDIEEEREVEEDDIRARGDYGARVMLQGSSKLISMFSQQGRKGINQDAMTVWEKFGGDEDTLFCGVFDGHGPSGHMVARHVRDTLPSKLSSSFKHLEISTNNHNSGVSDESNWNVVGENGQDTDDYSQNPLLNAWKSSLVKSFQDMDIDLETESTIESYCSGTTTVTIVKQVWDVLSNNEVISIVASARKRSLAARLLVDRAVRTWRIKYPAAKVDDCAVVCLFFKRPRPFLTKSMSEVTQLSLNYSDLGVCYLARSTGTEDGLETVLNCDVNEDLRDRTARDEGAGRVGSSLNFPRVGGDLNRRRLAKDFEHVET
ncbi:hypothetical protein RJ639_037525 [Escallonia herrerae]|uniref:PPM-type phosphatase domain-containing protein n=1 Tax=Escallonia herrerae TaxID=1293975 RepID=A0AA89B4V2_9ASTE|nr:hypothetical protein RJ639_037525 [Escallonia herrerae]